MWGLKNQNNKPKDAKKSHNKHYTLHIVIWPTAALQSCIHWFVMHTLCGPNSTADGLESHFSQNTHYAEREMWLRTGAMAAWWGSWPIWGDGDRAGVAATAGCRLSKAWWLAGNIIGFVPGKQKFLNWFQVENRSFCVIIITDRNHVKQPYCNEV